LENSTPPTGPAPPRRTGGMRPHAVRREGRKNRTLTRGNLNSTPAPAQVSLGFEAGTGALDPRMRETLHGQPLFVGRVQRSWKDRRLWVLLGQDTAHWSCPPCIGAAGGRPARRRGRPSRPTQHARAATVVMQLAPELRHDVRGFVGGGKPYVRCYLVVGHGLTLFCYSSRCHQTEAPEARWRSTAAASRSRASIAAASRAARCSSAFTSPQSAEKRRSYGTAGINAVGLTKLLV